MATWRWQDTSTTTPVGWEQVEYPSPPEARPDGYIAWLTEGLIAFGELHWRVLADDGRWPYYGKPADDFAHVACVLGHVQLVFERDPSTMDIRKAIRIMPTVKSFIEREGDNMNKV